MENEKKQKMFSIGQFAEIGNVSVKQLRYLEHKKILEPDLRDPENNYRYYSGQQLETLVYVKSLRSLGFELNQIVDIAQNGNLQSLIDALQNNLAGVKKEISDAALKYENIIEHLIHVHNCRAIVKEHTMQNLQDDIQMITAPARYILFIRGNHTANVEELFIDRWVFLKKYAEENNFTTGNTLIAIFHENYLDQFSGAYGDLETAFEITGHDVTAAAKDNFEFIRKLEEFKGVSAIHIGNYKHMQPLYKKMESWAAENSVKLSGAALEEYILGPDIVSNSDEYVTRLILPVL